ncbi:MAG: hypothetical protein WDA09_05545 [Bacteriovoracaceae bacterium]
MLTLNYGLHVLFTLLCLLSASTLASEAIKIFIIGRIERLELFIEMLKQEYVLREFSDLSETIENLEYACDRSDEIHYKESEIKRFKKKLIPFLFIFLFSFIGMGLTDSPENVQQRQAILMEKLK